MEVFISWSGEKSKAFAEELKDWLPKVINAVQPWVSSSDIDKGARWGQEISVHLATARFGIVCLTRDNLHSDWILFEAGAMSKLLEGGRTWTFLIDLPSTDVPFPLAQFQYTQATQADILALMHSMNKAVGELAVSDRQLEEVYEVFWPILEKKMRPLSSSVTKEAEHRSERELLEEVLQIIRGQQRDRASEASEALRNEQLVTQNVSRGQQFEEFILSKAKRAVLESRSTRVGLKREIDQGSEQENSLVLRELYLALSILEDQMTDFSSVVPENMEDVVDGLFLALHKVQQAKSRLGYSQKSKTLGILIGRVDRIVRVIHDYLTYVTRDYYDAQALYRAEDHLRDD